MRKILLSPVFTIGLAVVLLSLAIWFVGDLVAFGDWRPFDSSASRFIAIGVLIALWAAVSLAIWLIRRRRNRALVEELAEPAPDLAAEAIDEEQTAVQAKFAEALKTLSRLRFRNRFGGRRYLYELPWYVFIGPPGSGKTTALRNCGLEFPLAKDGEIGVEGVAGTRNCDWVFADEAVFIDTAGRWTTQDAHERVDAAAWSGFLDLLNRNRPEEPLNGVIVAISVGELAAADAATVDAYAAAIRERLLEIYDHLDATVPVYVVFTKCDLLVGFTEFFQTLGPTERQQVWGATFPLDSSEPSVEGLRRDLASVDEECEALVDRAGEIMFARLNEEQDLGERARVYEFPAQFSSFKHVVTRFLSGAFRANQYSRPVMLRGFYFTSATQQGQPVDRLLGRMARNFGISGRVIAMLSGSGRSYFLHDLLARVIFPEAGLVKRGRSRTLARAGKWAGLAACVALPIVLAIGWSAVRSHNAAQAAEFRDALATYQAELEPIELDPVADENLVAVLPALDTLRAEAERLASADAEAPFWGLGLDDTDVLREQAESTYRRGLERLFRPRLLFHLERLMEESLHDPQVLYDNLKAYLMLGGRGVLDTDYLRQFFARDWAKDYGGVENADAVARLQAHLAALTGYERPPEIELDNDTIARARDAVAQISMAERAFLILRSSEEALELRPWRVTDVARTANDVFSFRSGAPIEREIPGLFTYDGFWSFFIHNVGTAAEAALEEKWLIVDEAEPNRDELVRIRREILDIYYDEYIRRWNELLEDLRFTALGTPEQAAEVLNFLSSNRSPFRLVLQAVARETSLSKEPAEDSALLAEAKRLGERALLRQGPKTGRLILAGSEDVGTGQGLDGAGDPVEEAFAPLHDFVGTGDGESELDAVMASLEELYRDVQDLADQRGADISVLATTPAASRLSQDAKRAPLGISDMLDALLTQASAATSSGVRAAIDSVWKNSVYPLCRSAIHGKYPFGTGDEVAIGDLERLLAPGGELDVFFNERLKPMVDTSATPWTWRPAAAGSLSIPQDRLAFFEQAARIRDAFFPRGSATVGLPIQVFPIAIDDQVQVGRFEVGGAAVSFTAQERTPGQVLWPGAQPANGAQASVVPPTPVLQVQFQPTEYVLGEAGVWGLFKLLDKNGFRRRGEGDRLRVRFGIEGRSMLLELRFNSMTNPLALRDEIRNFRCPASL